MSSRRTNKSHKVPNVKLRPAQPSKPSTSSTSKKTKYTSKKSAVDLARSRTEDSGFDSDQETSYIDHVPRPFKGVILCATGISDKTAVFKQAIELGAQPIADLTDKVTHLIALGPGSPKYRCALETRIPIMHPSWITESYNIWLKGDDVDFEESFREHRLPIFTGVVVSLSGVEPLSRRTQINKLITANGGTYVKNLERPVKVTHLLCGDECFGGGSEGDPDTMRGNNKKTKSDKVMYAEKFNERKEAEIHIVWEEWFWDSIKFGGRFEEAGYLISKPRPKEKILDEPAPSPPPRSPSEVPPSSPTETSLELPPEKSQRKLATQAQPASDYGAQEEEEVARVKRIPAVTLEIWGSLLKPRGFQVVHGKLVRSPRKAKSQPAGMDEPPSPLREASQRQQRMGTQQSLRSGVSGVGIQEGEDGENRSALARFRKTKSMTAFAPSTKDVTTNQPFQRAGIPGAIAGPSSSLQGAPPPLGDDEALGEGGEELPFADDDMEVVRDEPARDEDKNDDSEENKGLFCGLRFRALGEAKSPSVKGAVEEAGGKLVSSASDNRGSGDDEDVDYIIVRLVSGSKIFREDSDPTQRHKYRTECWLERCLFEERICESNEHISFVPLAIEIPVPGAQKLSVSFSGLSQSESLWIRRLFRALGIPLAPNFSRRTTHLLCPSRTGTKFEKAIEWGVPVVDMGWLASIATSGVVPSIVGSRSGSRPPRGEKPPSNSKGKGRAIDPDAAILNHSSPDSSRREPPEAMFGTPSDLLSNPRVGSSQRALSAPRSSLPPRERTSTPQPPPSSALSYAELDPMPPSSALREEMASLRIPSSNTPSPMKSPVVEKSNGDRVSSPTEVRYQPAKISREVSKVLQESITSILGKRQELDDDSGGGGVNRGKRPKPVARTKERPIPPLIPPIVSATKNQNQNQNDIVDVPEYPTALSDGDASMGHTDEDGMSDPGVFGVIYEDPNQFKEKQRLLELLEAPKEIWEVGEESQSGGQSSGSRTSGGRTRGRTRGGKKGASRGSRKSQRVGGF